MHAEFCLECGHLLPKTPTKCSFCGFIQDYDFQKDIMAGFSKEIEHLYGYNPPDHLSFNQATII